MPLAAFAPSVSLPLPATFPTSTTSLFPLRRPSPLLPLRRPLLHPIARTSTPTSPSMLLDSLLLRTSPRWITVEPANPAVPHENILFIDRNTLAASLRTRADCAALAEPDTQTVVYGLVGLLDTLHDAHLLVVSERVAVGHIMECPVWRVKTLSAIPVRGRKMLKKLAPQLGLTTAQLSEETSLRSMLTAAIALPGFYFSHALDLTRSAQQRADLIATAPGSSAVPDFARADMRFVWNRFAAQRLVDLGAVAWIVPIILGYVDVRQGLVNGKAVQMALVSRRGANRPGLRFTARGADVHGNCSNFVETEQIVSHGDAYSSYVQIRGSIPLLWKQEACIRYKPKPELKHVGDEGKGSLCQTAFEKHFDALFEHYGPVTAISLIDNRGSEAMLYGAYQRAVDLMANAKLHFVPWDFHLQTKGMKYEKVDSELLPSIDADLEAYSYFYTKDGTAGGITRRQRGVVRTNCIDSLDRTNVVQSVIAHRMMDAALKVMGVLDSNPETCSVAKFEAFEKAFKNTWADHANAQSQVYAGSGALKTDFTRTGKRSKPGIAQDGVRALRRYVYQNFLDGQRQDGIDVMLGVVRMPDGDIGRRSLAAIKTKAEPLLVKEKYLPHMMMICMMICAAGIVFPKAPMTKAVVAGVAFLLVVLLTRMVLKVGHKLVARPRLNGTH